MRRQPTTAPLVMSVSEEHRGDEGSEPDQLGSATQRRDDVAQQPASKEQLNRRTGQRPDDHRCGSRQRERDKTPIPSTVGPHDAPEGQRSGQQDVAGISQYPISPRERDQPDLGSFPHPCRGPFPRGGTSLRVTGGRTARQSRPCSTAAFRRHEYAADARSNMPAYSTRPSWALDVEHCASADHGHDGKVPGLTFDQRTDGGGGRGRPAMGCCEW